MELTIDVVSLGSSLREDRLNEVSFQKYIDGRADGWYYEVMQRIGEVEGSLAAELIG